MAKMSHAVAQRLVILVATGLCTACQRNESYEISGKQPEELPTKHTVVQGKSDDVVPPDVQRDIQELAKRQSQGLNNATIVVHRAFPYRKDCIYTPKEGAKMVAIDIEFQNANNDFDLDDVDVLDGTSGENYGSNPDLRLLRADGSLEQDESKWDSPSSSLRVLLIYAVPTKVTSVKLSYWGHSLTRNATVIGEGSLQFDNSQVMKGAEFWPYPRSRHYGDVWQRGRWLIVRMGTGEGVMVVDLQAWPLTMHHWDCNLLRAIERAPQGGWIVITRTGHTRDDIRFPVWHHPEDKPGASPIKHGVPSPGEHLEGIIVIHEEVYVFEDQVMYQLADGRLNRVGILAEPQGISTQFGQKYTHGQIKLAEGRRLALWDGDVYRVPEGQWERICKLGINEPYEFWTLPWERDGFYFLEDRRLFRVRPGAERQHIMSAVENVMGIHRGPNDTILFSLGDNDQGMFGGIWFPEDDTYIPLRFGELSGEITSGDIDTIHWSKVTRRFYILTRSGVYTVPEDELSGRPRVKLEP